MSSRRIYAHYAHLCALCAFMRIMRIYAHLAHFTPPLGHGWPCFFFLFFFFFFFFFFVLTYCRFLIIFSKSMQQLAHSIALANPFQKQERRRIPEIGLCYIKCHRTKGPRGIAVFSTKSVFGLKIALGTVLRIFQCEQKSGVNFFYGFCVRKWTRFWFPAYFRP